MKRLFCAFLLVLALTGLLPLLCMLPLGGAAASPALPPDAGASTSAPAPGPAATAFPEEPPLLIWDSGGNVVRTVAVRDFLIGAAAAELPLTAPDAAIRAQMIASHSWALYQKAHADGSLSGGYFASNPAQRQTYMTEEALRLYWGDSYADAYGRFAALADEVQTQILLWEGAPACTCYHAISAGHTRASQDVWDTALPYLQGVDSPTDKDADGYAQTTEFTPQQLYDACVGALGFTPEGEPSGWVGETVWNPDGYVDTITLCGHPVGGNALRGALYLRSACFSFQYDGSGIFTVTTHGYGHGVGMSQAGAMAMAKAGSSAADILAHYYPGTVPGSSV